MKQRITFIGDYKKVLFAALVIVFMGSFAVFGSRSYTDTVSYELMSPIREPAYCLFLRICTVIFGTYAYTVVAIIQNLLAAVVCFVLLDYIISKNNITSKAVQSALFVAVLMPYVITPLFTVSKLIITNAMLTEGITLSLYNLYIYLMLHVIWEKKKQNLYSILSILTALLLTLTRGQMLVTLIAWFIVQTVVLAERYIKSDKHLFGKKMGICMILLAAAFGMRTLAVGTYNSVYNGVFASTPYGNVTLLTNILYVSERDAGEQIKDETLRSLYYEIYDKADACGWLYDDAPKDFRLQAEFLLSAHDTLKMDIIEVTLGTYIDNVNENVNYLQKLIIMDDMAGDIIKAIAVQSLPMWIWHYIKNILVGLIRSVALLHPLLYIPVLVGYLFLIAGGIYLGRKDNNNKVFCLFLLTTLLTAGMVGAVSITIMCLSRYMIYNTSLIYMCGILLLWEIMRKRKEVE